MAAFQQLGPFISTFADAEEKISENEDSSCLLAESTIDYEATKTSPLAAQEENSKETVNEKSNEGENRKFVLYCCGYVMSRFVLALTVVT